jgi:outer membrane lipoprotein-sorting protein
MVSICSNLARRCVIPPLSLLRYWLCLMVFGNVCASWGAATNDMFSRWLTAQNSLGAWTADFVQTRSLNVLAQPLTATGKVWVNGPNEFRWELEPPAQTLVLRQPDQLLVIYPRLKRVEKYALSSVPTGPVKDALALLDASFPRDRASVEARFRLISTVETNSVLEVTLQPKSASARRFVREIQIGLHTNDFSMASTEMRFADGSTLRNDFSNVAVRQSIPPERFTFQLPPDFTVVDPLHP